MASCAGSSSMPSRSPASGTWKQPTSSRLKRWHDASLLTHRSPCCTTPIAVHCNPSLAGTWTGCRQFRQDSRSIPRRRPTPGRVTASARPGRPTRSSTGAAGHQRAWSHPRATHRLTFTALTPRLSARSLSHHSPSSSPSGSMRPQFRPILRINSCTCSRLNGSCFLGVRKPAAFSLSAISRADCRPHASGGSRRSAPGSRGVARTAPADGWRYAGSRTLPASGSPPRPARCPVPP